MSQKLKLSHIDFDIGIVGVTPSTQEAFHEGYDGTIRKAEKDELVRFRENFNIALDEELVAKTQFPSRREVFVFVIQYFAAENEYVRRDIDNMAKTILDILKGRFYYDDSQVKTLLVGKKRTDHRVDQNFAYVAIKELNDDKDIDALKISGVERAVTAFQESQAKLRQATMG
jgi:Holliday junction resolvase RusA-like endonuclease